MQAGSSEAKEFICRDAEGLQQLTMFGQVRETIPGAVCVFQRNLRVETAGALVPDVVGQRSGIVEYPGPKTVVVTDAFEFPVEPESAGDNREGMADHPKVLVVAHFLREKREHRL